jgi:hypothetical protein
MAGMPSLSLSAGGGGPSGSSSNAGVMTPISNPFNFDHSGWNVTLGSSGVSNTAQGNKDANATAQTGAPAASSLGSILGSVDPMLLIGGAAVLLLLKRQ